MMQQMAAGMHSIDMAGYEATIHEEGQEEGAAGVGMEMKPDQLRAHRFKFVRLRSKRTLNQYTYCTWGRCGVGHWLATGS
jgi:hypothetical protein